MSPSRTLTSLVPVLLTGALLFSHAVAGAATFSRTYGGTDDDYGNDIVQTPDGEITVVGETHSFGTEVDPWVLRLDGDGTILWQIALDAQMAHGFDTARAVAPTANDGVVIAGRTYNGDDRGWDIWVIWLDDAGNQIRGRLIGSHWTDIPYAIIPSSLGGVFLVGHTNFGAGQEDGWAIKLDALGNVEWERSVGGAGHDGFFGAIETRDGGLVAVGKTQSAVGGAGGWDALAIKFNAAGNPLWQRSYGMAGEDTFMSVAELAGGDLLFSGGTESSAPGLGGAHDGWVVRATATGSAVWSKAYGGPGNDHLFGLSVSSSGRMMVTGSTTSSGFGGDDGWLMEVDPADGRVLESRALGWPGPDELARVTHSGTSSDMFVVGSSASVGAGGYDVWVQRLDADGTIPACASIGAANVVTANAAVTVPIQNLTVIGNSEIVNNVTAAIGVSNAIESLWCSGASQANEMALLPTYDQNGISGHVNFVDVDRAQLVNRIDFNPNEYPLLDVDLQLTPDGATALMATYELIPDGSNLRIIDVASGAVLAILPFGPSEALVNGGDVVVTPDGRFALVGTNDVGFSRGHLTIVDIALMQVAHRLDFDVGEHLDVEVDVVVTPDGSKALAATHHQGNGNSRLHVIDIQSGTVLHRLSLKPQERPVRGVDMVVTGDSSTVLFPAYDALNDQGRLHILDLVNWVEREIALLPNERQVVDVDVVITPDDNMALLPTHLVPQNSGNLRIVDIATATVTSTVPFYAQEHPVEAVDVVVTSDSATAVMATHDANGDTGRIRVIDVATGQIRKVFKFDPNERPFEEVDIVLTPDGKRAFLPTFMTVGNSGRLWILDLTLLQATTIAFDPNEYVVRGVDVVLTQDNAKALIPLRDDSRQTTRLWVIDVATATLERIVQFGLGDWPIPGVDVVLTADPLRYLLPTGRRARLHIIDLRPGAPSVSRSVDFLPTEELVDSVDVLSVSRAGVPRDPLWVDEDDLPCEDAGEECDLLCGQYDVDGDGVPDHEDNCPGEPNPDQADQDGDGDGDLCDVCPADAANDPDGVCNAAPAVLFRAYNDLAWREGQPLVNHTNITTPRAGMPSTGILVDFDTGAPTEITLSVSGGRYDSRHNGGDGRNAPEGTDAGAIFGDRVNTQGAVAYVDSPDSPLVLRFGGLDPDGEFAIAFHGDRGYYGWDRASLVTLRGADAFLNQSSTAHDNPVPGSDGALFSGPDDASTRLPSDNPNGYVARFAEVHSGPDGVVELVISADGIAGNRGKYANAVMIEQRSAGCDNDAECDDGNVCTHDVCQGDSGCTYTDVPNPCDDGVACTENDTCTDGVCSGEDACDEGMFCDLEAGACVATEPAVVMTAYNDLAWRDDQLDHNITHITAAGSVLPTQGELVDYATGAATRITLTVTGGRYDGASHGLDGRTAPPGSDAREIFGGIVDTLGAAAYVNDFSSPLDLTFTGLNPDATYTLVFHGDRGSYGWDRAAQVSIVGAEAFTNESSLAHDNPAPESDGALFTGPADPSTRVPADNPSGYVARFAHVEPGEDGAVTLLIEPDGAAGPRGKYASAVMIRQFSARCQVDADCDDGLACTTDERCVDAVCRAGVPDHAQCDDGNLCTDDVCDSDLGCVSVANGRACDDGMTCTSDDFCENGICVGADDCPPGQSCDPHGDQCVDTISGEVQFRAYNDLAWAADQLDHNVTHISSANGGSSMPSTGELIDYASGNGTGVTLTVAGGVFNGTGHAYDGGDAPPGTDAADLFAGIVSTRGAIAYVNQPNQPLDLTFAGLQTGVAYTLTLHGNRGAYGWDRASRVTIDGALTFTNASSAAADNPDPASGGALFAGPDDPSTRLPAGNPNGYVARFTDVTVGESGVVTLTLIVDGNAGWRGKYASAVMLEAMRSGCDSDLDCQDNNPCTDDACDLGTSRCVTFDNNEPCDDGLACTLDDMCGGGECVGVESCPWGAVCDLETGQCVAETNEDWIAYNDLYGSGDMNAWGTTGHDYQAAGEPLVDYITGAMLPVTVTGTTVGGYDPQLTGSDGPYGTDADAIFGGIVSQQGTFELDAPHWQHGVTFDGLDPDKRYTIVLTGNRNNGNYVAARFTRVTLIGADTYTNTSTEGVIFNGPDSVSLSTGFNPQGYVARWTDVTAADGSFSVLSEWDDSQGGGRSNTKGYAMSVFQLIQHGHGACGDAEICDGIDNDCDGEVDEGLLNACGGCGDEPEEICDGLDNNCDGEVDEGVLNACGACGDVPEEICDGLDNDCDGVVDNGLIDENGQCQSDACADQPQPTLSLCHEPLVCSNRLCIGTGACSSAQWFCAAPARLPIRIVALEGDPVAAGRNQGGLQLSAYSDIWPIIGDGGDVVFAARVDGDDVDGYSNDVIWKTAPGGGELVRREGEDLSSLTGESGAWLSPPTHPRVTRSGAVVYSAGVENGPRLGVGLWRDRTLLFPGGEAVYGLDWLHYVYPEMSAGGTMGMTLERRYGGPTNADRVLVVDGDLLIRDGRNWPDSTQFDWFVGPNDAGDAAFGTESYVWLWQQDQITTIAQVGDALAGTGLTINRLIGGYNEKNYALSGSGELILTAWLENSAGVVNKCFLAWQSNTLRTIGCVGDAVPGVDGTIQQFSADNCFFGDDCEYFSVNDQGLVAFATWRAGVESYNGVWLWRDGETSLWRETFDYAPGGGRFLGLTTPQLNDRGQMVLIAGVQDIESPTSKAGGLWVTDTDGNLHLAVREGDEFDLNGDGTDVRVVSGLESGLVGLYYVTNNATDRGRMMFNDAGELTFRLEFTDGTWAVGVASTD